MICIAATGMNNVDLQEAERLGIAVRNVANYSTDSVAQVTVAMVLSLIHRPALFDAYVKSGTYSKSPVFTHHTPSFYEIRGKKWGIIGLGTIGKRVAELATALGADVSYYSTSGKNLQSAYPHLTLEALASQSDILSVHAPLNEQTQGLINQKILHCMKPEALLINVGRGGIVAENDLAQALREKRLAGAGIDVFETEPVPAGNPLLAEDIADRLLLTPHLAWASSEARQRLIDTIVSHIRSL